MLHNLNRLFCQGAVFAPAAIVLTACFLAAEKVSAALLYEGFAYTAGDRLVGKTNTSNVTPKTWNDPPSPGQPETVPLPPNFAPIDPQRILAGNLDYPTLKNPTGNSFLLPRGQNNTEAPGNATQGNIVRIELPGAPYTSGSLFFSFSAVLLEDTWIPRANGTGTNQAGNTGNQDGGFFAGFSPQSTPTEGMSLATSFASQLRVRRKVATGGIQQISDDGKFEYELGIHKTNAAGFSPLVGWDTGTDPGLKVGQTVLVVGEYEFVPGATNDITRLWVNPDPTGPQGTASATSSGGADVIATGIKSFYFRSDNIMPANFRIDELRIGTTYADVLPPVPEPNSVALVAVGLAMLGSLRRGKR